MIPALLVAIILACLSISWEIRQLRDVINRQIDQEWRAAHRSQAELDQEFERKCHDSEIRAVYGRK